MFDFLGLKHRTILLLCFLNTLTIVVYSINTYQMRVGDLMNKFEQQSLSAARSFPLLVSDESLTRSIKGTLTPKEGLPYSLALSRLADRLGIQFLYALREENGKFFFVIDSMPEAQITESAPPLERFMTPLMFSFMLKKL